MLRGLGRENGLPQSYDEVQALSPAIDTKFAFAASDMRVDVLVARQWRCRFPDSRQQHVGHLPRDCGIAQRETRWRRR